MSLNLKPNLLIGHLLPGCFFLLLWLLAYNHWSITDLKTFFHDINATELIGIGIILLIAAFLFGEIFDSARDGIVETIFEALTRKKIKWEIFFDPSPTVSEKLTKLEDNCFTWYVFNLNSALSLIAGGIVTKIHMEQIGYRYIFFWIISVCILLIDALVLRKELVTHSNNSKTSNMEYPHDGVFTRIKPSPIHGVGVFAIRDIKKGAPIFKGDEDTETIKVSCAEIESSLVSIQEMYEDFCPKINGYYECPRNFNQMPISWYLNDARGSLEPNLECRENLLFYALRDIKANEELLVRYDTYSE